MKPVVASDVVLRPPFVDVRPSGSFKARSLGPMVADRAVTRSPQQGVMARSVGRLRWIALLVLLTISALAALASGWAPTRAAAATKPRPRLSGNPGRFVAPATSAQSTSTSIAVNGGAGGRAFDGVG